MHGFRVEASGLDASVNFVAEREVGRLEARYVRRDPRYFVVYLSAQTGCRQGCRMCHLTASGQTALRDATAEEILAQADRVLRHPREPAETVHFNFMARGEPLASEVLLAHGDELVRALLDRGVAQGLRPRVLVSTILPRALGDRALQDVFVRHPPDIYASLYSMDERFRRRWLPQALPAGEVLDRLGSWQRHTNKVVKLHHALIAGENDAEADAHAICDAVVDRRLLVHVNLVRYNPYSPRQGQEPEEEVVRRHAAIYASRLPFARVKVVPRVGTDVAAACGMFR